MQREVPSSADSRLASALEVLASEVRLAILRQVRTPKALSEIVVRLREPDGRTRPIARQTVSKHLTRLRDLGVVIARETERDYGPTVEYVLDHRMLFALSEDFRGLARLRAATHIAGDTHGAGVQERTYEMETPCLILVHGLEEGSIFLLDTTGPAGEWLVGRHPGADVFLDFDPYVSAENSLIRFEEGAWWLEDLPESRNGTLLNFRALPEGGRHRLENGDLIGAGRSLLLFRS